MSRGVQLRPLPRPPDLPGVVNDEGFAGSNRGTLSMAFFCGNPPDLDYAERAIRVAANEAPSLTGVVTVEPATP